MDHLKVLIAEDEVVSRLLLKRTVEGWGHECLVTQNGVEAWALLQRTEVDVVISDWVMPAMDGIELCHRVRQQHHYTYFILLTALDDKGHFLEGMSAGADDYLSKPWDAEELQARLFAAGRVMALHRQLERQNSELTELNRVLGTTARTDPLTGLSNRLQLSEDLADAQGRLDRYGFEYAVALCDVDHFKGYNDRYGHLAGDGALRAIAQVIASKCRVEDHAYRYGGEEFLILMAAPGALNAVNALTRIRRAVQALGIPHALNDPPGVLTISGGIAVPTAGILEDANALLTAADAALYEAKGTGRNRVVVFRATTEPGQG